MRITSTHLTALDRQVTESVNILTAGTQKEGVLNQKNEWGGAKIPSILIKTPKGVAKNTLEKNKDAGPGAGPGSEETLGWYLEEAVKRGRKKLDYVADDSREE